MTISIRFARRAFLVISLALFSAGMLWNGASAQSAAPMPMGGLAQVVLTDDDISNFIASFPKLQALGDKYGGQIDRRALAQNPTEAYAALGVSAAAIAELNALLSVHGFSSVEHWQSVAYSTVLAHGWRRNDGEDPMRALDEAIAGIGANPTISEDRRAMLIANIEAQRKMISAFRPLPENVERVAKFEQELNDAVGE